MNSNAPTADRIAHKVRDELAPWCEQIEIAGSIRRRRPDVGDIDLVLLPKNQASKQRILDRCALKCQPVKSGEQYSVFNLTLRPGEQPVQLDLWFAHCGEVAPGDLLDSPRETAPGNFGVLLLARTGSAMFNVWLAQQARARGLHFNPHRGIQRTAARDSRVIAATDEAEIFTSLGLAWIPPEKRER